jgi:hypothetical protein
MPLNSNIENNLSLPSPVLLFYFNLVVGHSLDFGLEAMAGRVEDLSPGDRFQGGGFQAGKREFFEEVPAALAQKQEFPQPTNQEVFPVAPLDGNFMGYFLPNFSKVG